MVLLVYSGLSNSSQQKHIEGCLLVVMLLSDYIFVVFSILDKI